MSEYPVNDLNKVKRSPKRGNYERKNIYRVLDDHFLCHACYVHENIPIAIPTAYGRKGDTIFLHGALKNRLLQSILGKKMSLTVTHMDGIVMARSVFHHSFNYRSVVVFGNARLVEDEAEKMEALELITENIIANRWSEARIPNERELKTTLVLAVDIEEASLKERSGDPVDEDEDYDLNVWAGVLPFNISTGSPKTDTNSKKELPVSSSAKNYNKFTN